MTAPAAEPTVQEAAAKLIDLGIQACQAYERADIEKRLRTNLERLDRPDTVVCVVGEFKKGKSSLVNGLLGQSVCPVDDDLATAAVTMVRSGAELAITVRRRDGEEVVVDAIGAGQIADYVAESGNPGNRRRVDLVEIAMPHQLLDRGVTLVDTPGLGGLSPGHAAATRSFLPSADALFFITDASAELSRSEIEFLTAAREVCPTIVALVTKIDLFPEWRRIVNLDRVHLDRISSDIPLVAISSVLRLEAFARQDGALNNESGFPALLDLLQTEVLDRAAQLAVGGALHNLRSALDQIRAGYQLELDGLLSPKSVAEALEQLARTRARLEHLRGPGSRWSTLMSDGFNDLSSQVDYQFRAAMRTLSREIDEELEKIEPAHEWLRLSEKIQGDTAAAVAAVWASLGSGSDLVNARIVDLLAEEELNLPVLDRPATALDVHSLWPAKQIATPSAAGYLGSGFGALRGAQGGIMTLGMVATLMGTALAGPALWSVGAFFGGKQIFDERKKQVAQRRQQAKTLARQFLDDVQFEVSSRIRDLTRDLQRGTRDQFSELITELLRTHSQTADALQRGLKQDEGERAERADLLSGRIAKLEEVLRRALLTEEAALGRMLTS